jgi:hypothetical protein
LGLWACAGAIIGQAIPDSNNFLRIALTWQPAGGNAVNPEEQDKEWREEAERLALLPKADQREIIALHRSVADNPKVRKADREAAAQRADALEKHLGLRPKRKRKNP